MSNKLFIIIIGISSFSSLLIPDSFRPSISFSTFIFIISIALAIPLFWAVYSFHALVSCTLYDNPNSHQVKLVVYIHSHKYLLLAFQIYSIAIIIAIESVYYIFSIEFNYFQLLVLIIALPSCIGQFAGEIVINNIITRNERT